jgi:hypothetical protein
MGVNLLIVVPAMAREDGREHPYVPAMTKRNARIAKVRRPEWQGTRPATIS